MNPPLPRPPTIKGDKVNLEEESRIRTSIGSFSYSPPNQEKTQFDTYYNALQNLAEQKDIDPEVAASAENIKKQLDKKLSERVAKINADLEKKRVGVDKNKELPRGYFTVGSEITKKELGRLVAAGLENTPENNKQEFLAVWKDALGKEEATGAEQEKNIEGTSAVASAFARAKKLGESNVKTVLIPKETTRVETEPISIEDTLLFEAYLTSIPENTRELVREHLKKLPVKDVNGLVEKLKETKTEDIGKILLTFVQENQPTEPQKPVTAESPSVTTTQTPEANGLVNLINHFDTQEKVHDIPAPESQKDLPHIPDMEPGQKVLLENADTLETDTWTIDALENGTATLKRVVGGKEETRTYPAGKLKDIMRLNAYYENALARKEAETQREQQETAQSARKVLRSEWRKKQNLGKGNFIKPTEHIQPPKTAEDLPDIGVIKPGQVITLQDKESLEIAEWTVAKIEDGIAFVERKKEGGEKEERNLSIDSLREILKTNLYYKNALRAEEEQKTVTEPKKEPKAEEKHAQEQKEGKQELKAGDTISLLNKTKTASHTWIIESISQEGDTTRVHLKSKDGTHSLRLPLEEVLGGIEATNEWKTNPDNKKESFSNPPIGELIKIFNENRKDRKTLYELYVAWDNKYIASGLIDQMREKSGNIAVSVEQIESTKKLLQAYKKILELDANESYIPGIRAETELEGNIVTLAKILSGKTTTKSREDRNNIETLVSGYSATGAAYQLERLEKAIQGAKPFTTQQNQEEPKKGEPKKPEMGPDGMPSAFEAVYEKLAETQGWAQKEVDTLKKDLRELSLTHSHYAVKMIRANIIKRDLLKVVEQLHRRMEDYVSYAETYEDFFRESANGTFAIDDDKRVKSVRFVQTLSSTKKLIDEIPLVTEQVFKSIDERLQKPDVNAIQVAPTFTYTHTKQPGGNQSPRQEQRPSQEDVSRVDAMADTIQKNTGNKWGRLGTTIGVVATTAAVMLGVFGFKNKQEKEVSAAATPPVATQTAQDTSKVTQWNHPEWFQNINESKEKDLARMIGRTDSKQFLRSFIINPDMEGKPIATPQSYESIYNTIGLKANVPYAAYFDTEREITPETAVQVNNSYFDLRVNMGKAVKALIEAQDRVGLGVRPELPKVTPQEGESFSEYFGRVQKAIGTQLQKKDSPYQV